MAYATDPRQQPRWRLAQAEARRLILAACKPWPEPLTGTSDHRRPVVYFAPSGCALAELAAAVCSTWLIRRFS